MFLEEVLASNTDGIHILFLKTKEENLKMDGFDVTIKDWLFDGVGGNELGCDAAPVSASDHRHPVLSGHQLLIIHPWSHTERKREREKERRGRGMQRMYRR